MCKHSTNTRKSGFGSFHSDDIEVLLRQNDNEYQRPAIFDTIDQELNDNVFQRKYLPDGHSNRNTNIYKNLFQISNQWIFLNHGAFGATMKPLQIEANRWRTLVEDQPLRFYDRTLLPSLAYIIREMSKYLNCPVTELVPIQNVTYGLNSIINSISLTLQPSDAVVCLSLTYGSTKKILQAACTQTSSKLHILPIKLPIPSECILLELFENSILEIKKETIHGKIRLVVLDQITSNTALALPIIILSAIVKKIEPDCIVLIDAAHSLFSQPIQIYPTHGTSTSSTMSSSSTAASFHSTHKGNHSLNITVNLSSNTTDNSTYNNLANNHPHANNNKPSNQSMLFISDVCDIWISNGHKWLCAPKGCAVMWLSSRFLTQHGVKPAVISHGYLSGTFDNNHKNTGR